MPKEKRTLANADAAIRQARQDIDFLVVLPAQAAQAVVKFTGLYNCLLPRVGQMHPSFDGSAEVFAVVGLRHNRTGRDPVGRRNGELAIFICEVQAVRMFRWPVVIAVPRRRVNAWDRLPLCLFHDEASSMVAAHSGGTAISSEGSRVIFNAPSIRHESYVASGTGKFLRVHVAPCPKRSKLQGWRRWSPSTTRARSCPLRRWTRCAA
ncbi:hypothetical protein OK006_7896 [Actinobacteria bacterium OK006]|nr:hypothetical protein OK006_7896 [Actinobacteria bacterium OK006]